MSAPRWQADEVAAVVADIAAGRAYLLGGATSDSGWSLRFVGSGEPGEGAFLLSEWHEETDETSEVTAQEVAALVRRTPRHAVHAIPPPE